MDWNNVSYASSEAKTDSYLKYVYLWMCLGLLLTALTAYLTASSETLIRLIYGNRFSFIILCVAELAVVMVLSGRIERLSVGTAFTCFFLYSALTGVTFSSLVLLYAGTGVLFLSFLSTAVVFGGAALYGTLTKKSIKGWGGWLGTGLIAVIVVSIVNVFIGSTALDMALCAGGVLLFSLLTAWDSQKLIEMQHSYGASMAEDEMAKLSIMGALDLYLDFINIFLYLVRIFGGSRRDS